MKFLVLGVSGMAGHTIALYLQEKGHEVVGFSRKSVDFITCIKGDATNEAYLKKVISEGRYDIVVNAIGILNKNAEQNKSEAVYLNAYLPHRLVDITYDMPTRIFHMSTDCVFKGNTGPYSELSIPDGNTFYDRSKALGELNDDKNLTFRNSIVGPDINEKGIGLFNWFMKQKDSASGFTGALWTGLTTLELAKAIECAAQEQASGLVNMVLEDNISKYDLLCLFNKNFKDNKLKINLSNAVQLDKTLLRTNFDLSYKPKSYDEQIKEMALWVKAHKDLYPHYELN